MSEMNEYQRSLGNICYRIAEFIGNMSVTSEDEIGNLKEDFGSIASSAIRSCDLIFNNSSEYMMKNLKKDSIKFVEAWNQSESEKMHREYGPQEYDDYEYDDYD
jgi:hypothetical protein